MLFNSYSYEILYEQFHLIHIQGDIKLLLVTVNNRLKFEIEIVHDLSCHPICMYMCVFDSLNVVTKNGAALMTSLGRHRLQNKTRYVGLSA